MDKLNIRAFRACDEPDTCQRYLAGHRAVLEAFGIQNVSTNTEAWCEDPDTYVIVAENPEGAMVGGIRVEVSWGERTLPIVSALKGMDPKVECVLDALGQKGTGEVCGLWNSNVVNGRNIPEILSFAAVSLANQVGITTLNCLVAHYTLRHALKVGFTILDSVGDEGTFTYPIPSIKAIAMVIPNAITLDTATEANRHRLLSLRIRPEQTRREPSANGPWQVTYQLLLDRKVLSLVPYRMIQMEHLRHTA